MIHETSSLDELRKNKGKIIRARDIVFNRAVIEQKLVSMLVIPAVAHKKDSLKYLDSGFNSIALRAAAKSKVTIGIDLPALRNLSKKELALEIGRIEQNIKLCRKCNVTLAYTGEKEESGAKAFLRALGASSQQADRAISF